MRNINDPRDLSAHRPNREGEIDSSADPGHGVVDLRGGIGRGEHLVPMSTPEHATDHASAAADGDAREDAVAYAEEEKPFGGLTPSEAAQRRWSQERQLEQAPAVPAITAALERKARAGDVHAAREYREWLAMGETEALRDDLWLEALDDEERGQVIEIIERALARYGLRPKSPHPLTPEA
jgi:hypothetical protein